MSVVSVLALLLCTSACVLTRHGVVDATKLVRTQYTRITTPTDYSDNVASYLQCWLLCKNMGEPCENISFNEKTNRCLKSSEPRLFASTTEVDMDWTTYGASEIAAQQRIGMGCVVTSDCIGDNVVCLFKRVSHTVGVCFCTAEFRYNNITDACDIACNLSTTFDEVWDGYIYWFNTYEISESMANVGVCIQRCISEYGASAINTVELDADVCNCQSVTLQQIMDAYPQVLRVHVDGNNHSNSTSAAKVCL